MKLSYAIERNVLTQRALFTVRIGHKVVSSFYVNGEYSIDEAEELAIDEFNRNCAAEYDFDPETGDVTKKEATL